MNDLLPRSFSGIRKPQTRYQTRPPRGHGTEGRRNRRFEDHTSLVIAFAASSHIFLPGGFLEIAMS
ncbi:hypothetical protein LZ32DRAFT_337840 [Colletotrichum eremochloae]|nr:hypothetical protein LZ32DRAFT_337840 [Colletotrichum eremochloae]